LRGIDNSEYIYALDIEASTHIKKVLIDLKEEIDSNMIIVWDFITPLSAMDRSST
jgi:hypothetical protein